MPDGDVNFSLVLISWIRWDKGLPLRIIWHLNGQRLVPSLTACPYPRGLYLPEGLVPPLHGFKSMDSQNPNLFKQVALHTDRAESFSKDFLIYYPMT